MYCHLVPAQLKSSNRHCVKKQCCTILHRDILRFSRMSNVILQKLSNSYNPRLMIFLIYCLLPRVHKSNRQAVLSRKKDTERDHLAVIFYDLRFTNALHVPSIKWTRIPTGRIVIVTTVPPARISSTHLTPRSPPPRGHSAREYTSACIVRETISS